MDLTSKVRARKLLQARDLAGIAAWAGVTRGALGILFSLTFDPDELLRRRAIEAIGVAAQTVAGRRGFEKVRDFLRRLFWLLNDESGGQAWHAPEAIGEILVNVPALIAEYGGLLIKHLDDEAFAAGTCLAMARVGKVDPTVFANDVAAVRRLLTSPDAMTRGAAALALGTLPQRQDLSWPKSLVQDDSRVVLYDFDAGILRETTVAQIPAQALRRPT